MKKIQLLIIFVATSMMFSSCYKESHWVDDNTTGDGKHIPVIQSFKGVNTPASAIIGDNLEFVMTYFSVDDVASTTLHTSHDDAEVQSLNYAASKYVDSLGSDQVFFNYTIPDNTTESPLAFYGKVTSTDGLDRTKGTVSIDLCHKEIAEQYTSYIIYSVEEFEYDENGTFIQSTIETDTIPETDVTFTKIDDNTYNVDDGTFGLINDSADPEDPKFPLSITRDICAFQGSKAFALVIDENTTANFDFKNTGVAQFNKQLKFDWTIDIKRNNDLLIEKWTGTSILTEK